MTFSEIITLLQAESTAVETLRQEAEKVCLETLGDKVFFRGLVEFSNMCINDCFYCGIRKSNASVERYTMQMEDILEAARWCSAQRYGSIVLQSGERQDEHFIAFVEEATRRIKQETVTKAQPEELGITLSVGEQTLETYQRFREAGAQRYLLRIETTSPKLFSKFHPEGQRMETRIRCLRDLKTAGFQVGTGVMIGLPGQTLRDLTNDLLFFRDIDVDMIGMGPYVHHDETPEGQAAAGVESKRTRYRLSLKMIAVARLLLRDVNIASATALQALNAVGREEGIRYGANIIMPQLTPQAYRRSYQLYEGKPFLDADRLQTHNALCDKITALGRTIGWDEQGNSRHVRRGS